MDIVSLATIAGTVITALFASLGSMFVYLKKQGFFEGSQNMTDYMEVARQSGKRETSNLVEAMNKKLDFYHEDHMDKFDKIIHRLDTVNGRLGKHDIAIAVHEEKLKHAKN
jgi:hypothetical protein